MERKMQNEELITGRTERKILELLKQKGKISKSHISSIYSDRYMSARVIKKFHSLKIIKIELENLIYQGVKDEEDEKDDMVSDRVSD